MKQIVVSSEDHINEISKLLSAYFQRMNEDVGGELYNTDAEKLKEHVSSKIEGEDENVKYFSLVENDEFSGFMTVLKNEPNGEILVVATKDDNKEDMNLLVDYGVDYLKNNGCENIFFETQEIESNYKEILENIGAKVYAHKWKL